MMRKTPIPRPQTLEYYSDGRVKNRFTVSRIVWTITDIETLAYSLPSVRLSVRNQAIIKSAQHPPVLLTRSDPIQTQEI